VGSHVDVTEKARKLAATWREEGRRENVAAFARENGWSPAEALMFSNTVQVCAEELEAILGDGAEVEDG
jgi:hypothetical protein